MVVCLKKKIEQNEIFFWSLHSVLLIYKVGKDVVNQALSLARRSSPDEFSLCQGMICAASLRNPCSTVNLSI